MFEGSEHHDSGYFEPLQQAGGTLNGSTNTDRTNYWEVVPSSALELALWMESDRMGFLLPALTEAKFENQRDVVLNERRQNYENRPVRPGAARDGRRAVPAGPSVPLARRSGRPTTCGPRPLDDVRAFFRRYYHPANASLAIAGDIDADAALDLAARTSATFPPASRPGHVRSGAGAARPVAPL